jgi:hypothetical protein
MTAQGTVRALILLGAFIGIGAGCDYQTGPPVTKSSRLVSQSVSHTDPDKQLRFKEALRSAGVPHEIHIGEDGREYVRWRGEHSDTVAKIELSLFGEPLPEGRSIHFGGEMNDKFKKWLKENNIAFETRMAHGKEFVIWAASDYPKIVTWQYFPKHYVQHFPPSSNPTVDPDARKSGARGSP